MRSLIRRLFPMHIDTVPGWRPKHRGRPALVATTAVEPEHQGADDAYAKKLHALVEEVKAERAGEKPPPPLTGELTDAEREAVVAAIQSKTTEVPIVDPLILLERDTQRWFDDAFAGIVEEYDDEFAMVLAQLVDDEELQTALLRLARSQRAEYAQTVELPTIAELVSA